MNLTDSGVDEEGDPELEPEQPFEQQAYREHVPPPNDDERLNAFDSAIDLHFIQSVVLPPDFSDRLRPLGTRIKQNWCTKHNSELRIALLFIPLVLSICTCEHLKWYTLLMFELPTSHFLLVSLYGFGIILMIFFLLIVKCAFSKCKKYSSQAHLFPGILIFMYAVPFALLCVHSFHMLQTITTSVCDSAADNSTFNISADNLSIYLALDLFPEPSVKQSSPSKFNHSITSGPQTSHVESKLLQQCYASVLFAIAALSELLLEVASTAYFVLELCLTSAPHWRSRPRLSSFFVCIPRRKRCFCFNFWCRLTALVGWALCLIFWPFAVWVYYEENGVR